MNDLPKPAQTIPTNLNNRGYIFEYITTAVQELELLHGCFVFIVTLPFSLFCDLIISLFVQREDLFLYKNKKINSLHFFAGSFFA